MQNKSNQENPHSNVRHYFQPTFCDLHLIDVMVPEFMFTVLEYMNYYKDTSLLQGECNMFSTLSPPMATIVPYANS